MRLAIAPGKTPVAEGQAAEPFVNLATRLDKIDYYRRPPAALAQFILRVASYRPDPLDADGGGEKESWYGHDVPSHVKQKAVVLVRSPAAETGGLFRVS